MHTIIVITTGFVVLAALLLAGRLSGQFRSVTAAKIFIPVWFLCAVGNMSIGVIQAGYSVAEELPILAIVFGVPAAVAALVWWRAK